MKLKEVLEINGYDTDAVNDKVLEFDTGMCRDVREIAPNMDKLFEGVQVYNKDDESKIIVVNFEAETDDEFLPLSVLYFGADDYLSVEIQYDENLEVVFVNDLR